MPVVVDASLAIKWLIEEADSPVAHRLSVGWEREGIAIVGPHLLPTEVANAIHRRVRRRDISVEEAIELEEHFLAIDIEFQWFPELHLRAIRIATLLAQGAAYDSHYLALAELLDCEFWTADRHFYQAANATFPRVRWIGEV